MKIKFRVFDKISQIMHYENSGFHVFTNGALGYNCGNNYDIIDSVNFGTMLSAGLKDKNGKEIYEGDICYIFLDKHQQIVYNNGCLGYMACTDTFISFAGNMHFEWKDSMSNKIEVIGNIYENPELLNPKF